MAGLLWPGESVGRAMRCLRPAKPQKGAKLLLHHGRLRQGWPGSPVRRLWAPAGSLQVRIQRGPAAAGLRARAGPVGRWQPAKLRLGVISCAVNASQRFQEALRSRCRANLHMRTPSRSRCQAAHRYIRQAGVCTRWTTRPGP